MIIVAKPNPDQNPSYTSRELVNFNKKIIKMILFWAIAL